MLPDLESLRCFEAAARHLNFRAAAEEVALSPAAFSDRIRRLEEQLESPLFARTTRKVSLASAGHALLPQARRTLDEARRCLAAGRPGTSAPPFALKVGTRFELGLSWLTPSLGALRSAHPERTLHLTFGDSADLLARVQEGSLDCAITSARLTHAWVRYDLLHEEQYVFVGSSKLVRGRPLRSAEDAQAHALIDLHSDLPLFRYLLDATTGNEVWGFARHEYLGTIAAARLRVLGGAGVAVLPRYFVASDLRSGRLVPLLPKLRLQPDHFRLVWREDSAREPELHALAAELRSIPLR